MKGTLKVLTVAGSLAMATNAFALAVPLSGQPILLSDNSAEYLINKPGSLSTDTTLDVGDRLRGMLSIGTVEINGTTTAIGGGTAYNELTAFFDIQVAAKIPGLGGSVAYAFHPYAGFATELATLTGKPVGNLGGAMVAAFEDSSKNYSRVRTGALTTNEDLIGTAKDGALLWVLGFTGAGGTATGGEGWEAFAFNDNVGNFTAAGATNGGLINYGLDVIDYGVGPTLDVMAPATYPLGLFPNGVVQLFGSGSLISPRGFNTPFDVWDNVDMTINTPVPEPSTLLLLGAGLAGLGLIGRNRKRRS